MKKLVAIGVAIVVLVAVPVALAADSSTALDGYGSSAANPVVQVKGSTASSPAATTAAGTSSGGTLPFTGLDLAVVLVAGTVLVGLGFGLRRLGRDKA
jgi:hypothetical protein